MNVRKLSYSIGAEVLDFQITANPSPEQLSELKNLFNQYQILLFRDQAIDFETHVAFSALFGELDDHRHVPEYRLEGYPHLIKVTNEGKERTKVFGQQWHSDHSQTICPSMASLLHAHSLPEVGGETMFTNMYLAFETLSPGMQRMLEGMRAVHTVVNAGHLRGIDADLRKQKEYRNPPVVHPVVRIHPETGRKALYVSEMLTSRFENLTEEESAPLLQYLFKHSVQPEFVYRHQWRPHDLIMWDNRCTMHLALMDYDHAQLRTLFRTTLLGDYKGKYLSEQVAA